MNDQPRAMQFSLRTLLEIIAVLAVVLAFIYTRRSDSPAAAPQLGRFQIHTYDEGRNFLLFDTATGRCWKREYYLPWSEVAKPPALEEPPTAPGVTAAH